MNTYRNRFRVDANLIYARRYNDYLGTQTKSYYCTKKFPWQSVEIEKVNNTNWKRKRSRTGRVPIQNGIQLAIPMAFINRPGGEKINSFREARGKRLAQDCR